MKRISFLAVLIIALFSINSAKAQVGVHIGVNVGSPVYYEPAPVVVVNRPPVIYHERPVYYRNRGYYRRPVMMYHGGRRGYYGHRRMMPAPRHHHRPVMYRRW